MSSHVVTPAAPRVLKYRWLVFWIMALAYVLTRFKATFSLPRTLERSQA